MSVYIGIWIDRRKAHIESIKGADRILIMGPGETRNQLKKAIDRKKALSCRVMMVETTDKMTDRQIAARVRGFYEIEDED